MTLSFRAFLGLVGGLGQLHLLDEAQASAIALSRARPSSNGLPTILSQSMNVLMSLAMKGWVPYMAQVTFVVAVVALLFGTSVYSTVLCASNGLSMSSAS